MTVSYLEFERPVAELENKISEMKAIAQQDTSMDVAEEVRSLEEKAETLLRKIYDNLEPWQTTQVARHPNRPHFLDYTRALLEDFIPLAGDRMFAEDAAVLGGPARFRGRSVMMIGFEKGHDTETRMHHNFGMARPEGYRKAIRLMNMAERFNMPVIVMVDTPGAYPGKGAEERGTAEAIARCIDRCLSLSTPNVSIVVGEGGSGGAVAVATTNRVLMLEHSIYTVASPEASASILWRVADKAHDAAAAMKITAQNLLDLGVIDKIIPEPVGGAHRSPAGTMANVGDAIEKMLVDLSDASPASLRAARREKYIQIGRTGFA
ncbi:MAG: acetyl-CoA carboxylase carboxyltransferase subunit alpha [Parvularculales bacterium]